VLYVPDLRINLFSLIVAEMKGYRVCAENSQVKLVCVQDDIVVPVSVQHRKSLYKMNMHVVRPDCDCEAVAQLTRVLARASLSPEQEICEKILFSKRELTYLVITTALSPLRYLV